MFKKRKINFITHFPPSTNATLAYQLDILSKKVDLIIIELKQVVLQLNKLTQEQLNESTQEQLNESTQEQLNESTQEQLNESSYNYYA